MLPFKRKSDTSLTYRLKWAAWEWLYSEADCRAIGFEVRLEGPGGRVADVVGVGPQNRVYVVEVKASRADKARDDHGLADLKRLAARTESLAEAVTLTAGILEAAAALAQRSSLPDPTVFPAYRQAVADHERVLKRQETHARRIETFSTKFRDPAFLRTAHCHYIMAPRGLIRRDELSPYWGLLDGTPRMVVEAPVKQVRDATAHVLRNIAKANTSAMISEYHRRSGGAGSEDADELTGTPYAAETTPAVPVD